MLPTETTQPADKVAFHPPLENNPHNITLCISQPNPFKNLTKMDQGSRMKMTLSAAWNQLKCKKQSDKRTSNMVLANFIRRRGHPFRGIQPKPTDDIALVTHAAVKNKMDNLLTQLENWRGPSSVAIYIDDGETQIDYLVDLLLGRKDLLRFASIHIYMEYFAPKKKNPGYPHNLLRNLAMEYSDMSYALASDVDLIPGPPDCYEYVMRSFKANAFQVANLMKTGRMIMVMPSFDLPPPKRAKFATPDQLPKGKTQLIEMAQNETVIPFHSKGYVPGHNATDFQKWYSFPELPKSKITIRAKGRTKPTPTFYRIDYQENFEPYVIVYKHGLPRYWDRFRGYGFNKRSWMMELHRAGYEFATLTQPYLVHLAHKSLLNDKQRGRNWEEHFRFIDYLNAKYPLENGHSTKKKDKVYLDFKVGEKPSLKKSMRQKGRNITTTR